jgi:hypothetical protein
MQEALQYILFFSAFPSLYPCFYLPDYNSTGQSDQNDPPGYKMSREKINIIKSLDLIIIDEISMVRADTLLTL